MRQVRTRLSKVLAGVLFAVPAFATAMSMPQGNFDVQIYDRTENRLLPTYEYQGRMYVVGKPGNEYAVSLRNQGAERVMAVASVDGVNIVTGETASPTQSGYVLSPWQTADINGWRKSLANTAAFYFTDHSNSYAARTGRPNDVGVIGVAVYRERRVQAPVYPQGPYRSNGPSNEYGYRSSPGEPSAQAGRADAMNDAPASAASPPPASAPAQRDAHRESAQAGSLSSNDYAPRRAEKSLGTGHGRIEDSRTRYTDFERASSKPDRVLTIHYDTYNNLLAMGVPVWRDDDRYGQRKPQPRPFPRDPTLGFVPDPR